MSLRDRMAETLVYRPLARALEAGGLIPKTPSRRRISHFTTRRPRRDFETGSAQSSRLTADWTTIPQSPDQVLRKNLRILRARSREAVANYDTAKRFLGMLRTNVIGENGIGFVPEVRKAPTPGESSGELDVLANDALEDAWSDWGEDAADITGRCDFHSLEELFVSTLAEDGEVLVRLVSGSDAGEFGFALQFIDSELLDVTFERPFDPDLGTYVRLGVELDVWDRPVAYHLIDTSAGASTFYAPYSSYIGRPRKRIPAGEMIHAYLVERVGQKRGIPWLATPLLRMRMLSSYDDAALVAARVGAAKMGFLKTESGDDAPATANEGDEDGPKITDIEPGIIEELAEGQEFIGFDPTYPHEQFPEFQKAQLRGIASGLNVSYHSLSGDLEGVNFSSIRAGTITERDVWKILQRFVSRVFHKRVYREWLSMAFLSGKIVDASGARPPATRLEAFRRVSWQPRGWDWVDPDKDTKANARSVASALRSPQEIIRARGRRPRKVWAELAEAKTELEKLGIPWPYKLEESLLSGAPAEEPEPDEEKE